MGIKRFFFVPSACRQRGGVEGEQETSHVPPPVKSGEKEKKEKSFQDHFGKIVPARTIHKEKHMRGKKASKPFASRKALGGKRQKLPTKSANRGTIHTREKKGTDSPHFVPIKGELEMAQ